MNTKKMIFRTILLITCSVCLPCVSIAEELVKPDSDSPISALRTLLEAQNVSDLEKALVVTRGEAAKTVAPSFANTSRMGIQFDTKNIVSKDSKTIGEFTILTAQVSAKKGDKARSKDMIVAGTKIEGKWVITYLDDDPSEPKKEDYENIDVLPLADAEKDFKMWESRFSKLPKRR